MPISRYNQDGTVDIYNTKTGEVRTSIRPEDLGSVHPNLVAEYQRNRSSIEAYKTTGDVSVIPEHQRAQVINAAQATGYKPPKSEEELARETAAEFQNLAFMTAKELGEMPGVEEIAGMSGTKWNPRTWFRGTSYQDKKAKFEQLKSMLSLDNRQMLKGTGQISDFEAQMLQDAATALRPEMSDEAFVEELEKVTAILDPSMEITPEGIVPKVKPEATRPDQPVPDFSQPQVAPQDLSKFHEVSAKIDEGTATPEDVAVLSPTPPALGVEPEAVPAEDFVPPEPGTDEWKARYLAAKEKFAAEVPSEPASLSPSGDNKMYDKLFENRNWFTELIAGSTLDFGRDVIGGLIMRGKTGQQLQESLDTSTQLAEAALKSASEETNPEKRAYFESIAEGLLDDVQTNAKEIEGLFSDKVGKAAWKRGLNVGVEIASLAAIAAPVVTKAAKGVQAAKAAKASKPSLDIADKAVKTIEKGKQVGPRGILGKQRAKAVTEAGKLDRGKAASHIYEHAKKSVHSSAVKKKLAAMGDDVANIKTWDDFFRAMGEWGRAYTTKGAVRTADQAQAMNALYKGALNYLSTNAPHVYKYQRLLGYTYKVPGVGKLLAKILFYGGLGGGLRTLF